MVDNMLNFQEFDHIMVPKMHEAEMEMNLRKQTFENQFRQKQNEEQQKNLQSILNRGYDL